jgi:hypothetical protein
MDTILEHGDGSGGKAFCVVMQNENSIITPLGMTKITLLVRTLARYMLEGKQLSLGSRCKLMS